MKRKYVTPVMIGEEFVANRAIAACGQKDVVFDCMMGDQKDTTKVLADASTCERVAGTTKLTVAEHGSHNSDQKGGWNNHSDDTGGTWVKGTNGWRYTAPSDAVGLLYICSSDGTSYWTENGNILYHNLGHMGQIHCQIAPIYNINDVTVGS